MDFVFLLKIQKSFHFSREDIFLNWAKLLYLAPLRRYKHFCVFVENLKIQNGRHFSKDTFLKKIRAEYLANVAWGSTIYTKSLCLTPLKRYKQFCVFAENSKIQTGRHFSKDKIFLKFGQSSLQMYPGGRKFRRNRSISHR